jgi:hypothetical protein
MGVSKGLLLASPGGLASPHPLLEGELDGRALASQGHRVIVLLIAHCHAGSRIRRERV